MISIGRVFCMNCMLGGVFENKYGFGEDCVMVLIVNIII